MIFVQALYKTLKRGSYPLEWVTYRNEKDVEAFCTGDVKESG